MSANSDKVDLLTPSTEEVHSLCATEEDSKKGKHWLKLFPFSVSFLIGNEFCERFSYYGMRAVLILFFTNQLGFGDNSATALYHAFVVLCYLLPLLGAILSDSCLGKYGTILSLSVVYAIGNIIVSVSAIPFGGATGANIGVAAVGLVVIALGTGGIKPCVSAFGGDQFNKEGQEIYRRRFFSLFYFSINAGSVISTLLTPILRDNINCFNTGECFSLAFGVPAVLMILSLVIFVIGTKFYVIIKPKKEFARLFLDIPACILSAGYRRIKNGHIPSKTHWLQYASSKYSANFTEDVRLLLRVLVMFLPLPIFFALLDQLGSRWTLQAVRMNGQLGSIVVKPDQMQAFNPVLILICIPLFEAVVYPLAAKVHFLKRPLQRMVIGMVLAALAYTVAGFVQISIDKADTSVSSGHAKVFVINYSPETLYVDVADYSQNLSSTHNFHYDTGDLDTNQMLCVSADLSTDNPCTDTTYNFSLSSQHILQIVLSLDHDGGIVVTAVDDKEKLPDGGKSRFRVINTVVSEPYANFSLYSEKCNCSLDKCDHLRYSVDLPFLDVSDTKEINSDRYYYCVRPSLNRNSDRVHFATGAVYTIVLGNENSDESPGGVVELHSPNSVSLFLQVPMYILITMAEVLFSISGLDFAYSQAPVSMKSVCQAAWLWTTAFGNLIVVIVAEGRFFKDQATEFFFFAACVSVAAIIFAMMAIFYKYVDLSTYNQGNTCQADETRALIHSNEKEYSDK